MSSGVSGSPPDVVRWVRVLGARSQVEFAVSLGGCLVGQQVWLVRTHPLRDRGVCLTVRAPPGLGGRHVVTLSPRGIVPCGRVCAWMSGKIERVIAAVVPCVRACARVSPARSCLRELSVLLTRVSSVPSRRVGGCPAVPPRDFL
jgi:hypothetical protein